MFVAASTECWPDMELQEAIEALSDLEFTAVEIAIHESGKVKPSELLEDIDRASNCCATPIASISRATAWNWPRAANNITRISKTSAGSPRQPKLST